MKDLVKVFSKYLCCGAATAGVTAPITYLTTREDFTKDQRYLDIFDEVKKIEGKKESLGKEIEEKEAKANKLKDCLGSAEVLKYDEKDQSGRINRKTKVWFNNRQACSN